MLEKEKTLDKMKQPKTLSSLLLSATVMLSLFLTSCGVEGPEGPQGVPGRDGNANVISINYIAEEVDWYEVGTAGEDDFFMALDLEVPEINNDIMLDGLVLAYYRPDDQSAWIALPYTLISHNPSYVEKIDFIYDLGFVGLQSKATDKNASAYAGIFKIIVASAVPVGKKAAVDYSSYEAVAEWLNISETQTITREKK